MRCTHRPSHTSEAHVRLQATLSTELKRATLCVMSQSTWQVVIADRGWVYVGKLAREGDQVVLTDCHNVRRWGTVGGLGELALQGPREATVLDYYGTVRIHVLAVLAAIECNDELWATWSRRAGARREEAP